MFSICSVSNEGISTYFDYLIIQGSAVRTTNMHILIHLTYDLVNIFHIYFKKLPFYKVFCTSFSKLFQNTVMILNTIVFCIKKNILKITKKMKIKYKYTKFQKYNLYQTAVFTNLTMVTGILC